MAVALILVERSLLPVLWKALTLNKHSGWPNEMHQMGFFGTYAIL